MRKEDEMEWLITMERVQYLMYYDGVVVELGKLELVQISFGLTTRAPQPR